jgi:hypothetical protein
MKNCLILLASLILCSIINISKAQSQLSLLNGKLYNLDTFSLNESEKYIEFTYFKNSGKIKKNYADYTDIWSLNINGVDSIFYRQLEPEEYSFDEMKNLVLARQFAVKEYHPWWALPTGFIIGCVPMFMPLDPFSKILIPIAYVGAMNFVKPSKSYILHRYDFAAGNELFYYGYRDTARKKIFARSTAGVVGGVFLAGIIVGTLSLIDK